MGAAAAATDADVCTSGGNGSSAGDGNGGGERDGHERGGASASARAAKQGDAAAGSKGEGEGGGEGGGEWEDGRRRSPICETAQILAALVKQRVKTLAFCRTRKLTELTLRYGHQVGDRKATDRCHRG